MTTPVGNTNTFEPLQTADMTPHTEVLGLGVVRLGREIDGRQQTDANRLDLYQNFDVRLQQVRGTLLALDPNQQIRFGAYARTLLGARLPNPTASDEEVARHLATGHDAQLVHLLHLNVAVIEHQQVHGQPLFAEAKQRFTTQTLRGIDHKWISEDARELVERMRDLQVQVGDFAMTHMKELGGFFDLSNRIVIAQGIGPSDLSRMIDLQKNLGKAFDHEGNHAIFEKKFTEDIRPLIAWFTEPMAEHLHLAKLHGQPEMFSPADRRRARIGSEVYVPLRDFVDYVITAAPGGAVSPIYLTRAYTAKDFESPDWKAMEAQLDQAWGAEGAFWAIGRRFRDHMGGIQYELDKSNPKRTLTQAQMYFEAARRTRIDLVANQKLVFGQDWQEPSRQSGR